MFGDTQQRMQRVGTSHNPPDMHSAPFSHLEVGNPSFYGYEAMTYESVFYWLLDLSPPPRFCGSHFNSLR